MLDLLYTLFIAPIEFWMEKTLQWGFDHTQSWGWAIIIMSIVVNTVILPIYLKAEHWQEEERSIRKSFEEDEAMIKRTFKGQERFAMITTMHRQAGYSPLLTLRSSIGFFLQIPFFFAAYHFLSHFEPLQGISFLGLTDLSKPDELFTIGGFAINVMPILMTVINIGSALIYTHNLSKRDKYQLYGMAAIFLALLYNAAAGLVLYWTFNNIYSLAKNAVMHETKELSFKFSVPKISSNFKFLNSFNEKLSFVKNWNLDSLQTLFWPSSLLLFCLIFIYFPIFLYISDPKAFPIPMDKVLSGLIGSCQLFIFALFVFWFCCRGKFRIVLSFSVLVVLISAIAFAFVFEPDLGVMIEFVFQKPKALRFKWNWLIDLMVVLSSIILVYGIAKFNLVSMTKKFIWLSFASIFCFSIFSAYPHIEKQRTSDLMENYDHPPAQVTQMLSFSKTEQNIVVLMLDSFTGGHIKQILERDPSLASKLDGFTWYSETMTSGSGTIIGLPGILGGENLAGHNLINANRTETLEETINKEWASFFNQLLHKNFEISFMDRNWLKTEILKKYLNGNVNLITSRHLWEGFSDIWMTRNNFELKTSPVSYFRFFYTYGLFKITPLSLQRRLYKGGRWRDSVRPQYNNQKTALQHYAELDSLSEYSQVIDSNKNHFKFIQSEVTHFPWSLDGYCRPVASRGTAENDHRGINVPHLQTEYCAIKSISDWIKWLKKFDIYDNTMLVIVSDHGYSDSEQVFNTWNKTPPNVVLHSLLLFKPFNSHGTLRFSNDLTMNFDVKNMLLQNLGKNKPSPWKETQRVRKYATVSSWQRSHHMPNYLISTDNYEIKGTFTKKENWTKSTTKTDN